MTAAWRRRRRFAVAAVVLVLVAPAVLRTRARGAAGVLDASFGVNGIVVTDVGAALPPPGPTEVTGGEDIAALAVLGDGRIVVTGLVANGANRSDFVLARYRTDGALDPTFGSGGLAVTDFGLSGANHRNDRAAAMVLQPDNRIVAAGDSDGDFALVRYLPDGAVDTGFGDAGTGVVTTDLSGEGGEDRIFAVGLQPGGRIVAAGSSFPSGQTSRFVLLRYLADGGRDFSPFGGSDTPTPQPVTVDFGGAYEGARAIAVQPDGTVIAAGESRAFQGELETDRFVAARLTPDGALDPGFGDQGRVVVDLGGSSAAVGLIGGAQTMAVQADGAILLGGAAPKATDDFNTDFALVRLKPDGTRDPAFGDQGVVRTPIGIRAFIRGVAVAPDGRILAAGWAVGAGGQPTAQFVVARYEPDGTLDAGFGPAGGVVVTPIGEGSFINALALQPDGRAVVAGNTRPRAEEPVSDFALARYEADPFVSVDDLRVGEGDEGLTEARFTVTLRGTAGPLGATVDWTTVDGTAVSPADYLGAGGTLHFEPGEIEKTLSIMVKGDRRNGANRIFFLDLSNPDHAILDHSRAVATIVDDEPLVAHTLAGGPGLVARLQLDARESGAVLSRLCLDPRRAPCLDLAALPRGPGPNPRIIDGVTFEVEDANGLPAENTEIVESENGAGLRVGESLGIFLPDGVGAADLQLTRTGPPMTLEAFAGDGLSLGTATATAPAGQVERLRLPASPATEVAQQPFAVAAAAGFVYVADPANLRVRVLDPAPGPSCPCETVVAGDGAEGSPVDGADPLHSPLAGPYALSPGQGAEASDLYVADTFGHRILRVATAPGDAPAATITTVAGTGAFGFSGDGAAARSAQLNSPYGVARDSTRGVTYVADTGNHRIRAIAGDGTITTVAGDGVAGYAGDGGPATAARLDQPRGLALDPAGVLFVADTGNHAVRRLDPAAGTITTVAGTGEPGSGADGGPAGEARLDSPAGVAVADTGLYVADTGNHRIRRVDPQTGTITTVAGTGEAGFEGDGGDPKEARLSSPFGVAAGPAGDLIIADTGNNRVRMVSGATGTPTIVTLAGNGTPSLARQPGRAARADLAGVASVATWDPGGSESPPRSFLADPFAHSVREIDEQGGITTVVGDGIPGKGNGRLASPFGVATDRASPPRFLYVADTFNNAVRRVDLGDGNQVATVAGTGQAGFSGDGGPATGARLSFPTGVTVDGQGNLYIADAYNARIRRVDPQGVITTVAGTGRLGFSGDGGPATDADLFFPYGVAASGADPPDLYVADSFNHRIRRIDGATGVITTVAGNGTPAPAGDDGAAVSGSLDRPFGVAVDDAPRPDIYVADTGNGRLRRVNGTTGVLSSLTPGGALVPLQPAEPLASGPRGVAAVRRLTGAEVNAAGGKLVVVADSRGGRVTRLGIALAEPDAAVLAIEGRTFDLGCTRTCPIGTISITNPGSAPLAVRSLVISGDQAGDFRVVADGCTRRGVPRGQRCSLRIAFAPTELCPTAEPCRHAVLTVSGNGADGDRQVLLSGSTLRQEPEMHTVASATTDAQNLAVVTDDDAAVLLRPGGPVPTGTVDFYLCGPLTSAGGCPSDGIRIGETVTLRSDGHATSEQTFVPFPSGASNEYWCWRAEYGGDPLYLPFAHTDTTDECFGVRPGGVVFRVGGP